MIVAALYQTIYLLLITFLTVRVVNNYSVCKTRGLSNTHVSVRRAALLLPLFLSIFIGLRPKSYVFVDMGNYIDIYNIRSNRVFEFTWETENFIFDNFFYWYASVKLPIELFFLIISTIYFFCIFFACRKMFPNDSMLAQVVYLGAFSTFSYGTHGIKAGAAASIFLLALAYRKNKLLAILFLWISFGFHHSMLAPVIAYVCAFLYRRPKVYLALWLLCLFLAAAHVDLFQAIISGYTDEHGADYLSVNNEEKFVSGFRPDFILYSAIPIYIGYYLMFKKKIKSEEYSFLWCVYVLTNSVFLLCTYGESINRIAYLSWLMLPFVLLYPFVHLSWSGKEMKHVRYVVYGHLGFTLFMSFIYY